MARQQTATAIEGITANGAVANNSQAWSILFWFLSPDNAAGSNYAEIVDQYDTVTAQSFLDIQLRQTGAVVFFYRPGGFPQTDITLTSAAGFDDSAWHWVLFVSRAANDYEAWIDGTSIGTSTTNITDTSTTNQSQVGNPLGANNLPAGGRVARYMTFAGTALTVEQGRSLAYGGLPVQPYLWLELLGINSPEPDWSGNGNSGTLTGMTFGAHPPISIYGRRLWYSQPGFYNSIDEQVPSDNDYIWLQGATVGEYIEETLTDLPSNINNGVTVEWRGSNLTPGVNTTIQVSLREGGTVIATGSAQQLTDTPTTYNFVLTPSEIASIIDWTNLRLRFTVTAVG